MGMDHPDDGEHWLDEILRRVGQPVPCALCDTPYPAAELAERVVPAGFVDFDLPGGGSGFILREVIWVCAACRGDPAGSPGP